MKTLNVVPVPLNRFRNGWQGRFDVRNNLLSAVRKRANFDGTEVVISRWENKLTEVNVRACSLVLVEVRRRDSPLQLAF